MHRMPIHVVATCCQLVSTKVDAYRDRLGRRRSTKLIILATVDGWLVAFIYNKSRIHGTQIKVEMIKSATQ